MEGEDPGHDSDHDDEEDGEAAGGGYLLEDEGPGGGGVMKNRCDLLWQGIVARRVFHGFRFQVRNRVVIDGL
jgi:hypothetical protein